MDRKPKDKAVVAALVHLKLCDDLGQLSDEEIGALWRWARQGVKRGTATQPQIDQFLALTDFSSEHPDRNAAFWTKMKGYIEEARRDQG